MPRLAFAGAVVEMAKRALQILNLALVINFLPLGQFERFEDFLHIIECSFEFFDDPVHLIDCVGNRWRTRFRNGLLALLCFFDGGLGRFGRSGGRRFSRGRHGPARFAAPGVPAPAAPGTAPAFSRCFGLFGSALLCFVRRHGHRLPRRI